jgi:uncharacterized protein (TIGR02147 family)
MPNIYDYIEPHRYLGHVIERKKTKNRYLSLRSMAQKIGISPAMLSMFLSGKKNISTQVARKIALWLELKKSEQDYFVKLVDLQITKDPSVSKLLIKELSEAVTWSHGRKKNEDRRVWEILFAEWYYLPLIVILDVPHLRNKGCAGYADLLSLSDKQIRLGLEHLRSHGLIEKVGRFWEPRTQFFFESFEAHEGLRRYHKLMLERAALAIETQSNAKKFVGSETFAFSEEKIEAAKEILEDCFSKLVALSAESKGENLYHCGIQLFSLSRSHDHH